MEHEKKDLIKEIKRDESKDYLKVLFALEELPFQVGKNLLIDFLSGDYKNSSVKNNDLDEFEYFGSLRFEKVEILRLVDDLIDKRYIEIVSLSDNKFMKLLNLTLKGKQELRSPKKNENNIPEFKSAEITDQDRIIFNELRSYIGKYNDFQKKAIISDTEKILCIAGAGSGKTTVLTKRIDFLIKYRGVKEDNILAITFTRKARTEMQNRLVSLGVNSHVETFNSFCEKFLKTYQNKIYKRQMNVMSYQNKVMAFMAALGSVGIGINSAIDKYFTNNQKKNKESDELSNIFMNDCFFILDYFKSKNKELYDFSKDVGIEDKNTAQMLYKICLYLNQYLKLHGLRDYTDQLLDTINFLKENKDYIPQYDYILIDEFQDVNSQQIELIDLMDPKNLFCVGDPRQSIFGWRGSDIRYILDFQNKYPGSEIITLKKNYRSNNHIVEFINLAIKNMRLPDLEHDKTGDKNIYLFNFDSEENEFRFVIDKIMTSGLERHEIFILARTNRQLNELSRILKNLNIHHIVKTDEINRPVYEKLGYMTLATIHSIKGLEAKLVFVIGCNELNFPCKASDHPVIEMIKIEEYDKEEEERRLFYVALSRAKHTLILTYTGKRPTSFINEEMLKKIEVNKDKTQMRLA